MHFAFGAYELAEHERVTSAHRRIGGGTSGSAAKWIGFAAAKDTDESFGSKQTAMLRLKRNISVHSSKARSSRNKQLLIDLSLCFGNQSVDLFLFPALTALGIVPTTILRDTS